MSALAMINSEEPLLTRLSHLKKLNFLTRSQKSDTR